MPANTSRMVAAMRCASLGVAASGEANFVTDLAAAVEVALVFLFMIGLLARCCRVPRHNHRSRKHPAAIRLAAFHRTPVFPADRSAQGVRLRVPIRLAAPAQSL